MIALEQIPIKLKINSSGTVNTERCFTQHDCGVGQLVFTIFREDESEIDYSQISKAYIILKFQDSTVLEPCECEISSDSITFNISCSILSTIGTVTGIVRFYSDESQIFTTNMFRFIVISNMFDDDSLINEDSVSIVNQMLSDLSGISFNENDRKEQESLRMLKDAELKVNEDARISNENIRLSSEIERDENESTRKSNEDTRGLSETTRIDNEVLREQNEATRGSEFNTIKTTGASLITELENSFNQMVLFSIPEFSNVAVAEIDKLLFSVPTGYEYTLTNIKILSNGQSIGIDDTHSSTIQLLDDLTILATEVFNDINVFPIKNEIKELTILNPSTSIDGNSNVFIKVSNQENITTPSMLVQINYNIKKI